MSEDLILDEVGAMRFPISTAAGGDLIPLDPATTNNRTVVAFRSGSVVNNDMSYGAPEIADVGDSLLEPGDPFTITVYGDDADPGGGTADDCATANAGTICALAVNDRWTQEIQAPVGAVIDINRSTPAASRCHAASVGLIRRARETSVGRKPAAVSVCLGDWGIFGAPLIRASARVHETDRE